MTLVSTRQLRREYNHQRVLDAVAAVAPSHPGLHYTLCGDGEYRADLERHVANLGLARHVTFAGRVPHGSLPAYLRRAQVYVSLQPSDGVSASLLEAMACGAFPIVSDNDANRAWISHGVTGYLVAPDDPTAVTAAISAALEQPELRACARRENLRVVAQRASIVDNIRAMCDRYRLLGGRR